MTAERILLQGTVGRAAYGAVALFAPKLIEKLSGEEWEPDARYFNALFGGRDLSIAAVTVKAAKRGNVREAVLLNVSCEATDTIALAQEVRARGGLDQATAIGLAFNLVGWATWIRALRRL